MARDALSMPAHLSGRNSLNFAVCSLSEQENYMNTNINNNMEKWAVCREDYNNLTSDIFRLILLNVQPFLD